MSIVLDQHPSQHGIRVTVRRAASPPAGFRHGGRCSWRVDGGRVEISHDLDAASISDSTMLDGLLPLVDLGVIAGQDMFEEAALGVIRSSAGTARKAWSAFYDNSIAELKAGTAPFSAIHRHARRLVVGTSVLEVGSCFGFLALQFADDGHNVHACDISPGAVSLLRTHAFRRKARVNAVVGDATDLPFDDSSVDSVTLIHLLEHLDDHQAIAALVDALRVARRRVVVAVPYEENPSAHFGHRVRLTEADLHRWASSVDHAGARLVDHHGGWLVLAPR
ncbi:mycofactocin oligosaccharide methyltransferase MftM [Gordonia sp. PKS22-38]|uniref:Mycofactocin oligosaccharide methyltransferase MftM n=1 Tax=Gordonia prachuapensis TaxID=3115651 RepID=A0ABU7MRX0_9ACTN|nr:mycofactocin oligosaccharide methyltransferase MftM [Gordonia sp. PKS22-38]